MVMGRNDYGSGINNSSSCGSSRGVRGGGVIIGSGGVGGIISQCLMVRKNPRCHCKNSVK